MFIHDWDNAIVRQLYAEKRLHFDVKSDSGMSNASVVAAVVSKLRNGNVWIDFDTHIEWMMNRTTVIQDTLNMGEK